MAAPAKIPAATTISHQRNPMTDRAMKRLSGSSRGVTLHLLAPGLSGPYRGFANFAEPLFAKFFRAGQTAHPRHFLLRHASTIA